MELPINFEFLEQHWQIRASHHREISDDMGLCDPVNLTVLVDTSLPPDLQRQVLWHELVHVVEQTYQLDMPERTVDLMALGLVHLLRKNPQLLATLQEPFGDYE
jgi:hypothetical protein